MKLLRIGTRTSKMALHQAELVRATLLAIYPELLIELVPIKSEGDCTIKNPVFDGKGVFVKKLDEALLTGKIDVAVNCMKDIPNDQERPAEIGIIAVLPREDISDALVLRPDRTVADLHQPSFRIGTSAPRRRALIQQLYPNAIAQELRGSCDTRIRKLDAGEVDALIVAKAGLERIGLAYRISITYAPELFLPAWGAGIITIDALKKNADAITLLKKINHAPTYQAMQIERAFINTIGGDCHTALGGYIKYEGDQLFVYGTLFATAEHPTYSAVMIAHRDDNPKHIGEQLAEKIIRRSAA